MSDLETFRAEARAWLEENCPPECARRWRATRMCAGADAISCFNPKRKSLDGALRGQGYTVPDWPKAYARW